MVRVFSVVRGEEMIAERDRKNSERCFQGAVDRQSREGDWQDYFRLRACIPLLIFLL